MKTSSPKRPGFLLNLATSFLIVAVLAFAWAKPASATLGATSAGATIHNVVQVAYKLSSTSADTNIYAVVDVTVQTVPTTATWYPQTGQTVVGGAVVNYNTSTLRSNANGPDQYTLTQSNGANTNATAQTAQSITSSTSPWVWGGITTVAAATSGGLVAPFSGTIGFPGGSVLAGANPLAVGNIIELTTSVGTRQYTVTVITPGSKNTAAAGLASNEVMDVVTATPVINIAANQLGTATVAVGTQVGQVVTVTFQLTAGNPTLPGTNGTDVTNLSALGAALTAGGAPAAAATTSVTTTITSLVLTVTKKSRILAAGSPLPGTTNIVPGSYVATTNTAKTGQIIEYLITVTNPAGNSAASSAIITDPTPAYTTPVAGSQSTSIVAIGTTPVTGVTATAGVNTRVWESGPINLGPIPGGSELDIVYQVTVN